MIVQGTIQGPCNCCGGSGGSCQLQCRSVSGSANLCGFPQFVATGTPKFYGSKTVLGSIAFGGSPNTATPPCGSYTIPNSWTTSGTCNLNAGCICGIFFYNVSFAPIGAGSTPGTVTYKASFNGACNGVPLAPGIMLLEGFGHFWGNGDTHDIAIGFIGNIHIDVGTCTLGGCSNPTNVTLEAQGSVIPQFNDSWNISEQYDLSTAGCPLVVNTNSSQRLFDNSSYNFPSGGGTTVYPNPLNDPPSYPSDITTQAVTPTVRGTAGTNVCVNTDDYPTLGPYINADGTVTESLSNQDTKDNAITRAIGSSPAWLNGDCVSLTSFATDPSYGNPDPSSFSYRKVQVRGVANGLTVGGQYKMTIGFYQRAYGSSDPFTLYATHEIDYVASDTTETSDYVDVPQVDGQEIQARTCGNVRTG